MSVLNRVLGISALLMLGACHNASPEVRFAESSHTYPESAGAVPVTVLINPAAASDFDIGLVVSGTSGNTDRVLSSPRTLHVFAGETSATFQVGIADDADTEPSETLIITLVPPGGVELGEPSTFTMTIVDDDNQPTVRFTSAAQSAAEASGTATATVQLSFASTGAVTVPYTLSGTSNTGDRTVTPPSPLTIPAGSTSATISIALNDDNLGEPDETLVITLGAPTGATLGIPAQHTLTIVDDDPVPSVVSFQTDNSSRPESAGAVNLVVQVTPPSASPITLPFTLGGTASNPADYTASASPITIPANAATANITVTIVDDTASESAETVIAQLSQPTAGNAVLGEPAAHTLTIADDDNAGPPTVSFAQDSQTQSETVGTVNVTVQVSPVSTSDITVPYTQSGTATSPGDYSAAPNPVVIPAGLASADIVVTVADDAAVETDETAILTLGAPSGGGAALGSPSTHTLTIADNDTATGTPQVNFRDAASNAAENAGVQFVTVEVSPPSPNQVTVPFTLSGSATPGADYDEPGSPLVIPPAGSASITIGLIDDAGAEGNETVVITLGTPSGGGATLGSTPVHTMTVVDDETTPAPQGTLFAITDDYRLLSFSSATPQTVTSVPVTGVIETGGTPPLPLGMDFRTATRELYLYTNDRRLYVLNTVTGAATLRGSTPGTLPGNLLGMDFDPCADKLRMIGDGDQNARLNPDGSLFVLDSDLVYATGDAHFGQSPDVSGIAYTACATGATTLFGIDGTADTLVRIGSVNGAPGSPNDGQLFTIGNLAADFGGAGQVGLDIDPTTANSAFSFNSSGTDTTLFRVNLVSGVATSLGLIGADAQNNRINAIAVQP
ncbi:MAG TPA: Calx-beta domain-containing protein [Solimonas sp.]|nr:Calx-beta domain-containing protein [Solimonas sp.]